MARVWIVVLAISASAHAYVRSRTQHGTAVYWPGSCIFMQPDIAGSPDLDAQTVFDTIKQSMLVDWNKSTEACSYIAFQYDQPAKEEAHLDGKNIVKFRTDKWCHPNDGQNKDVCYDAAAAAITTVFYLDRPKESDDGYIIDADVELNSINFTFVIVDPAAPLPHPRMGTSVADLENTLTHEFGHVQGLDHTCRDSATPANEVDDTNSPPPACNMLGSLTEAERLKITEATMYNSAQPGEFKKRSPEPDDVAGICAIYPIADAAKHSDCSHTDLSKYNTGGCQIAPGSAGAGIFFVIFAVAIVIRLRRKAQM